MTQTVIVTDSYCVDTCALIDLYWDYPPDVFPGVWRNVETLVQSGRMIAPEEVFAELEQTDDELLEWAKGHRAMFKACDAEQIASAKIVMTDFPSLVDLERTIPDADPFVIAVGKKGYRVVTSETFKGGRASISSVCQSYRIECLPLLELFRKEDGVGRRSIGTAGEDEGACLFEVE